MEKAWLEKIVEMDRLAVVGNKALPCMIAKCEITDVGLWIWRQKNATPCGVAFLNRIKSIPVLR
jgi:hypothetical protein